MDVGVVLAGLIVGFTVGLTGMGGGALMTPLLVLVFKVDPLTAVSSDVVASMVMKPIGGGVHLRRGTVNIRLVGWLCVGSVPFAFGGAWLIDLLGGGDRLQDRLQVGLGIALLLAAGSIMAKSLVGSRRSDTAAGTNADVVDNVEVRVAPTVAIGIIGGTVVGLTSVGSGSIMIVLLLLLYPRLTASRLVGTDLVQAVPLVASAAFGHLLFGDFSLGLTSTLLLGAVPGVYAGARWSARAPDHLIRPVLLAVLVASALKLLDVGNVAVAVVLAGLAVVAAALGLARRRRRQREPMPA